MRIALFVAGACAATMAHAQIKSVSDPSAYKPDAPKAETPAPPAPPVWVIAPAAPQAPLQVQAPVGQPTPTPAPTPVAGQPLNLTCLGGGTANKITVTNGYAHSNVNGMVGTIPYSGNGNSSVNVYGQRQQAFEDQVDIRLFGGDDRIRLPRTILPPIHGGSGGWFKLNDVVADARSIKASASINFMNHPKVHIDRVTGTISISGKAGDYTGRCMAVDANAAPQF